MKNVRASINLDTPLRLVQYYPQSRLSATINPSWKQQGNALSGLRFPLYRHPNLGARARQRKAT
jgi:hypothetical protein